MPRIENTGPGNLKVNFRRANKLYNMTTGEDASVASPHPFDSANIAAGESLDIDGEIISTVSEPVGEVAPVTGVESHVSPAEHAKVYPNGPGE